MRHQLNRKRAEPTKGSARFGRVLATSAVRIDRQSRDKQLDGYPMSEDARLGRVSGCSRESVIDEHAISVVPLTCAGLAADPSSAANARNKFQAWLVCHFQLDRERLSDLTLAVNEALANVVEHAYADHIVSGTFDLHAAFQAVSNQLHVRITDRGRWRQASPDPLHLRGRGILLMQALAEDAEISVADAGTTVTLSWSGIAPPVRQ